MNVNKICSNIASFINHSKLTQGVLTSMNQNPTMYSAIASFSLASLARPALIGCFNFSDKKDKRTSQAASISAGIVEVLGTAAIFLPLNKAIAKSSDKLYQTAGSIFTGNNIFLRNYKSITNRGAKLLALIPMSWARFSLVSPLTKAIFNNKKQVAPCTPLKPVVTGYTFGMDKFLEETKKGGFKAWG